MSFPYSRYKKTEASVPDHVTGLVLTFTLKFHSVGSAFVDGEDSPVVADRLVEVVSGPVVDVGGLEVVVGCLVVVAVELFAVGVFAVIDEISFKLFFSIPTFTSSTIYI